MGRWHTHTHTQTTKRANSSSANKNTHKYTNTRPQPHKYTAQNTAFRHTQHTESNGTKTIGGEKGPHGRSHAPAQVEKRRQHSRRRRLFCLFRTFLGFSPHTRVQSRRSSAHPPTQSDTAPETRRKGPGTAAADTTAGGEEHRRLCGAWADFPPVFGSMRSTVSSQT